MPPERQKPAGYLDMITGEGTGAPGATGLSGAALDWFNRRKKWLALWVLRLGAGPYKMLNKWGNRTLDYEIGEYSYGAPRVVFPRGKLKIGKFCSMAWDVTIFLGGNHRVDWISTYPFPTPRGRWPKAAGALEDFLGTKGDVTIGNDVWIGSNVTIMSGVTIADGAVIATRAVVTTDVAPYAIVAGNPAKLIGKRFDDDVIEMLLRVRWWDWPESKIQDHADVLCSGDLDRFRELAGIDQSS